MSEESDHLRELVAEVAAAYFSNSHVGPTEIPMVISQIAASQVIFTMPAASTYSGTKGGCVKRERPARKHGVGG